MVEYKFIPAMSAGSLFSGAVKDEKWADGTPYRYWNWDNEFRYPYFLITAGHFYKRSDISSRAGLFEKPDTVVFGDSGGFQIAKGTIEWSLDIRNVIFNWLEDNSTIAANLDIPASGKQFGFKESIEISKDNFDYFHKNQSGKTLFLNVMQGFNTDSYSHWYNQMKEFKDFGGWALGNASSSPSNLFDAVYVLIRNKEHLRSQVWHIFGTSNPLIVLLICHMQNAFNKLGLDLQMYSDSSSSNSARFGIYYIRPDYYNLKFRTIHVPYLRKDYSEMDEFEREIYNGGVSTLPTVTDFDVKWKNFITNDDLITYNSHFNSALSLRNTMTFIDFFDNLQQYSKMPYYFRKEMFQKSYAKLGSLMEEMISLSNNTDKLDKFYRKHKIFFKKFENHTSSKETTIDHTFFN